MRRFLLVFLIAVTGPNAASLLAQQPQQQQAAATALILGRVVDAVTGGALAGATVTIGPARAVPGSAQPASPVVRMQDVTGPTRVMTDDQGRFVFHGLPAGAFSISANKPGYMSGAYGRRIPVAPSPAAAMTASLVLAAGEQRTDVTVSLWKHGVIGGRVADEHGEPMIGVQVRVLRRTLVGGRIRLSQTGNMPATDDRGIYRISTLEPGEYVAGIISTQATMPASVFDGYAAAVRAGDSLTFTRMLSAGGGSIVRDGVRVGAHVLGSGSQAPGIGTQRVPGVLPPGGGRLMAYPTVYHPGVSAPGDAGVIAVNAGEERTNVDFQLRPVPTVHVAGTLTGPDGPVPHTALELFGAGYDLLAREESFEAATTVTDATGAFTFLGVAAGQYSLRSLRVPERPVTLPSTTSSTVIQTGTSTIFSGGGVARPPDPIPSDPTMWASMPVSVGNSNVSGLSVTLRTGARIRGRVQFDGTAKPPPPDRLQTMSVFIDSSDGRTTGALATVQSRTARFDVDGRLNSYQQLPGSYIVRAGVAPPGWTFAGSMLDGRDVSVEPLEIADADVTDLVIRFTDRPSELAGVVSADAQTKDADLLVVVFPVDPRGWSNYGTTPRRLQSSTHAGAGSFAFVGLPNGEYHAAAIAQDAIRDWRDPAFLKKLAPLATRVSVTEGQKSSVVLRPVQIR